MYPGRLFSFVVVLALATVPISSAVAYVPGVLSFQGRLTDHDGNPLTGSYEVTFRIFSAPSGGSELWAELDTIEVDNGFYNELLGTNTPLDESLLHQDCWLEMQVTGDGPMYPRYRLTTSPYAFLSAHAAAADLAAYADTATFAWASVGLDTAQFAWRAGTVEPGAYISGTGDYIVRMENTGPTGKVLRVEGNGGGLDVYADDGNGIDIDMTQTTSGTVTGIRVEATCRRAGTFINDCASYHTVYISNSSDSYPGLKVRGSVDIQGNLTKSSGAFKIDHPLDPQNKYLYHSFVESPDMMNIYNGNVILDENGEAWVELPEWFEALNRDFRYQLTAIGAPAPNLYISEEISDNRFKIAGGNAGAKVSWQVTGIRHDPYANMHRIPVEEVKPAGEAGLYLHPEAYGLTKEAGIACARE